MRVGFVCPYDLGRFGGVQDQIRLLAGTLRDRGHETVLVGPGATGPAEAVLVGSVTEVPGNGATTPLALSPRAIRRTAEALDGLDVIHVHEPFMPMVSLGAVVKKRTPTVGTFHADPSRLFRLGYRVVAPLLRRLVVRLDVITAVSPVAASAIEHLGEVRIVPNALDVSWDVDDVVRNEARVAFLGRNDPRKGLAVLLEAWPAVKNSVPLAELIVIGSDHVRNAPADVVFHGRVGEDRKRTLLASSGVFCAPNTGGESFGVTVAEAMAAGAAVVASDLPGFRFVLDGTGLMVPPGEPEALSDALVTVLTETATRTEMQRKGRDRAMVFDVERVASSYEDMYASVAGT